MADFENGDIHVGLEPPADPENWVRDEDVMDTWFSSWLWPFATMSDLGENSATLKKFYPTCDLVTGPDIIFFWVVRMVFSSLEIMEEVPFKYVYVHGLVRDAEGRKMSKSLGNGVDPLEVIDQYGADALRFMLMTGITPGNDMRFKMDKLESSRNFANKLWNASRFVIMNLQDEEGNFKSIADDKDGLVNLALKDEDKWMLAKVNVAVKIVTVNMDKFDLSLAAQKVYELIWNEYCDWYIELVKGRLYGEDEEDKKVARYVLVRALKDMLKMLHPFMPFITEEIWSFLPKGKLNEKNKEGYLIKENWPLYDENNNFEEEVKKLEMAMEAIRAIRNIRAEAEAAPSKKLSAVILSSGKELEYIKAGERYIKSLANITEINFITDKNLVPEEVMSAVMDNVEIFIPLDDLLDYKAEFERLQKEKTRLSVEVERVKIKLSNEGFVSKAPEKVIIEEREKMAKYEDMLNKVTDRLTLVEKKLI